jgi:hypothetical protein
MGGLYLYQITSMTQKSELYCLFYSDYQFYSTLAYLSFQRSFSRIAKVVLSDDALAFVMIISQTGSGSNRRTSQPNPRAEDAETVGGGLTLKKRGECRMMAQHVVCQRHDLCPILLR